MDRDGNENCLGKKTRDKGKESLEDSMYISLYLCVCVLKRLNRFCIHEKLSQEYRENITSYRM